MFSDNGDALVFNSCICCNNLISTDFGKVIGCSGMNQCCCLKQECCLKVGEKPMECMLGKPVVLELMLCKIACPCCSVGVKKPEIIVKGKSECCCFRSNCALPPDDDTPMMLALYGLLCYPKQGCCKKFSDAK
jgi:hypothetical protein